MTDHDFFARRRALLASMGGLAVTSGLRLPAAAQDRTAAALTLRARPAKAVLRGGAPESPIWALESGETGPLRLPKGEATVNIANELPSPIVLNWLGIDGAAAAGPLTGQPPLPAGQQARFTLPLRHAGTFMVDARLLGGGTSTPSTARALIVPDEPPVAADRDDVLLIEEWWLKTGGSAVPPGSPAEGAFVAYTVNGKPDFELKTRPNERLRLRFINDCARAAVGLKIENHEVRVIAIDSQPAEPFVARDGQLVLAPGSRIDAMIDATAAPGTVSQIILHDGTGPRTIARLTMSNDAAVRAAPLPPSPALPSTHLPARLDLQGAARTDVSLDPAAQWIAPSAFAATTPAAFQVKRGRTVVLAISNPTTAPVVFRLHGHHARLLDRLDDGWKPFWIDTLLVAPRQTQRIAFMAEFSGRWLMEATALNWAAPKLVRGYAVQ